MRNLEILYLQNNQISKLENLSKLKSLKYLQVALNNITKIENLQGLESLEKLDLTVNFIENPMDVDNLVKLEFLRELYLTGNPCTQKEGYRQYVITALPQLKILDSREIGISERIEARQSFQDIKQRFLQEFPPCLASVAPAAEGGSGEGVASGVSLESSGGQVEQTEAIEAKRVDFQNKLTAHTPEARLQAARDWELLKNEKKPEQADKDKKQRQERKEKLLFTKDGRILQKNEGKWNFKWSETKKTLVLDVEISKFIDTSLVNVDLNENWIRVTIKEKILQLATSESVQVSSVICERSKATGHLLITMLKSTFLSQDVQKVRKEEHEEFLKKETIKKESLKEEKVRNRRYERLFEPKEAVNIRNILEQVKLDKKKDLKNGIVDVRTSEHENYIPNDFVDDPDVPPLC